MQNQCSSLFDQKREQDYESEDSSDNELTTSCALHNLDSDEFCSSSGCSSTFYEDEDGSLVDLDSSDDDDEAAASVSSSSESEGESGTFKWRKNYTMSKILGYPTWLSKFKVKKFDTLEQLESFKLESESIAQNLLCRHAYNTMGSFNKFYEDYKAVDKPDDFDFDDFYFNYQPNVIPDSLSCVGLSMRLLEAMRKHFGDSINETCGTVSCEEIVKDPNKYNMHTPNTAKEHVLVALKFMIADGVVI